MDPVACLKRFDDAMMARDLDEIAESAGDMVGWLEKGGFLPFGPHGADWRGKFTAGQACSYFRDVRHVAEIGIMARK